MTSAPKLDPAAVRAITRGPAKANPGDILTDLQTKDDPTPFEAAGA